MAILVGRQEDGGAPARSGGSFGLGVPAHFGAAVRRLYLFIFGALLVLLIGFSGRDCFLKTAYLLPNGWLALIGVSAAALLYLSLHLLARYVERRIERLEQSLVHRWALAAATLLLFLTQMAIAYNIAFRTGWDAGVVFDFAWQTVDNQNIEGYRYYFSHYPNNILIAWMYIQVLRLYQAIAQGALGASHLHLLIALNCVISCTAALLVYRVVHLLSGGRCFAWMAWAAFTAVAGLSPWILIPYSDTVGILFPALAFFLYLRPFRSRALKGALMGLCLYAGYHIKPTAAIPFIAIAIVEAVRLIRRPSLWKRLVRPALSLLAVCVALQAAFTLLIIPSLGIDVDRELSLGPTHFIKMGLNPQTDGAYLEDDVLYSQSFANRQQRDQANMEVIRARLSEYGLGGYLDFLSRKALSVFNSGSFAWAAEGQFYKALYGRQTLPAAYLARYFYSYGDWHPVFLTVSQALWLAVLVFCFAFALPGRLQEETRRPITAVRLSLIGLVVYLLLFEARARYIYAFLPVLIIAAAMGFQQLLRAARGLRTRGSWISEAEPPAD